MIDITSKTKKKKKNDNMLYKWNHLFASLYDRIGTLTKLEMTYIVIVYDNIST